MELKDLTKMHLDMVFNGEDSVFTIYYDDSKIKVFNLIRVDKYTFRRDLLEERVYTKFDERDVIEKYPTPFVYYTFSKEISDFYDQWTKNKRPRDF